MDLLAIFTTLRRHKLIVFVVLLLIAAGEAYVAFGIPPQYESKAQYVLINPPPPPTQTEIEREPRLAKVNTRNPLLRLPNPMVVVDVIAQRVSGDDIRRSLRDRGADANYQVAATNAMASGSVIDITGTGQSAEQATRTLELVAERMKTELRAMQKVEGADDAYLIQAVQINPPTDPIRRVTGTLRSMIGIAAAGIVLLFALLSIAEAMGPRRSAQVTPLPPSAHPGPVPGADSELTRLVQVREAGKATSNPVPPAAHTGPKSDSDSETTRLLQMREGDDKATRWPVPPPVRPGPNLSSDPEATRLLPVTDDRPTRPLKQRPRE